MPRDDVKYPGGGSLVIIKDMRSHSLFLGIIGLFSGVISYGLQHLTSDVWYVAGFVFGATILLYVIYLRNWKLKLFDFLWIIISVLSYHVAVQSAIILAGLVAFEPSFIYILSGILGAGLMLGGFHICIKHLSLIEYFVFTILGGVLGLSGNIGGSYALLVLYITWQGGMAVALGYVLDRKGVSR